MNSNPHASPGTDFEKAARVNRPVDKVDERVQCVEGELPLSLRDRVRARLHPERERGDHMVWMGESRSGGVVEDKPVRCDLPEHGKERGSGAVRRVAADVCYGRRECIDTVEHVGVVVGVMCHVGRVDLEGAEHEVRKRVVYVREDRE